MCYDALSVREKKSMIDDSVGILDRYSSVVV